MQPDPVSFENTENAFAYKSDGDLKKADLLFTAISSPALVRLGTAIVPWAIRIGLPVKKLIRHTIYNQFVGGETMEETARATAKLRKFNVQAILDYGVEAKEDEKSFDHSCKAFIGAVHYASTQPGIPFISIKVTGMARFSLLEKLNAAADDNSDYLGYLHTEALSVEEKKEWLRVVSRMDSIIAAAAEKQVGVLVDAEESWIQRPIDALVSIMMEKYNRNTAVVYNTIQLYRKGRLRFFEDCFNNADKKSFILGVKLVRGAYMEKERKRAADMSLPSPIQTDKSSCDSAYNEAVKFGINHIGRVAMIIATHNEQSILYAIQWMEKYKVAPDHPHIHFSQLFGMSDNITFNLAKAGYPASKYLPFGPIRDVIPYLMRRAMENSSVAGQTGRELDLIRKEIKRRKGLRRH